jgi:hypothetical protein
MVIRRPRTSPRTRCGAPSPRSSGVCRVDTRRAVALLGHTDARMTMGVYAQLLKLGDGNVQLLEQLMGCTRDEARAIFESEPVFRTSSEPDAKEAPAPRRSKVAGA